MPKKTNKAAAKRFKVTKNGKVMYRPRPQNHYRARQTSDTIRSARSNEEMSGSFAKKIINKLLPHS